MAFSLIFFLLTALIVWLGILTFFLKRFLSNYRDLTSGIQKKTIDEVLINITNQLNHVKKEIAHLSERCAKLEKNELSHIQKIGLIRFNPFKDTGGEQSFILALTDTRDTGIIITALYSRTGMRWYAKRVVEGKGTELELSDEEEKALKMTKSNN